MRVKIEDVENFAPVCIVLETQEELDKFYAIVNTCLIADVLDIHKWYVPLKSYRKTVSSEKWRLKLSHHLK